MELKERLEIYNLWLEFQEHNRYWVNREDSFHSSLLGEWGQPNDKAMDTGEEKKIELREFGSVK